MVRSIKKDQKHAGTNAEALERRFGDKTSYFSNPAGYLQGRWLMPLVTQRDTKILSPHYNAQLMAAFEDGSGVEP